MFKWACMQACKTEGEEQAEMMKAVEQKSRQFKDRELE